MSIKKINKFTDKFITTVRKERDEKDLVYCYESYFDNFKYCNPENEFEEMKENFKYLVEKSTDLKQSLLIYSYIYLKETNELDVDFKRFENIENIIKETDYEESRNPATIGVMNKNTSVLIIKQLKNNAELFEATIEVDWFKNVKNDVIVKYSTFKNYANTYTRKISFYCY